MRDAFVGCYSSNGTQLTWLTYLGGLGIDDARALAVEQATGIVTVGGWTKSSNFPTSSGSGGPLNGLSDGFV